MEHRVLGGMLSRSTIACEPIYPPHNSPFPIRSWPTWGRFPCLEGARMGDHLFVDARMDAEQLSQRRPDIGQRGVKCGACIDRGIVVTGNCRLDGAALITKIIGDPGDQFARRGLLPVE